jgi:hypothetical protein
MARPCCALRTANGTLIKPDALLLSNSIAANDINVKHAKLIVSGVERVAATCQQGFVLQLLS